MIIFIILLSCIVIGLIPACLARRMKKNFWLWYVYSIFFLPVACLHLLLIRFNLKKAKVFLYILLAFYFLGVFYYIEWYGTTQPVALRELVPMRAKYTIATTLLDPPSELRGVPVSGIIAYFTDKTEIPEEEVTKILTGLKNGSRKNTHDLTEYCVDLLISLYDHFEYVEEQGEFGDPSVPMGAAKEVFLMYIDSLKWINRTAPGLSERFPAGDESRQAALAGLMEKNYLAMLETEATFFKTTFNSEDFLAHLQKQIPLAGSRARLGELADYYEKIGDIFLENKEKEAAVRGYEKAVALKWRMMHEYDEAERKQAKDEKRIESLTMSILIQYIEISDIYAKYDNAAGVLDTCVSFMVPFFEWDVYLTDKEFYKLESFIKQDVIIRSREHRSQAVEIFLIAADNYRERNPVMVNQLVVRFFSSIYFNLSREERADYAPRVREAYEQILGERDVYDTQLVEKAYNFFKEYRLDEMKQVFAGILEEIVPKLEEFENRIINENYPVFAEEMVQALAVAEAYLVEHSGLDAGKKERLNNLEAKVRNLYEKITDEVSLVVRGRDRVAGILKQNLSIMKIKGIEDKIRQDRNRFIAILEALRTEDRILNEEYDNMLDTCEEIRKLAQRIDAGTLPANSRNKNNLESMRRAVLNTNRRIEKDIEQIKKIKEEVGKKYKTKIPSLKLEEALARLQNAEANVDADFRKVFTEGLPIDRRMDLE